MVIAFGLCRRSLLKGFVFVVQEMIAGGWRRGSAQDPGDTGTEMELTVSSLRCLGFLELHYDAVRWIGESQFTDRNRLSGNVPQELLAAFSWD